MKKRVIGLTLVVCLLFSTTAFASSTSISQMSPDMNAAIEVATSYLEDAAYSQYFYDAQDLVAHTIEVIPENEKAVLSQSIAEYPSFRSAQAVVPYEDTSINTGTLQAFEENLELHRDSVAYYGHLNELENTTYKYFTPSYDVVDGNIDGDFATVNVYETIDFQYSDCDEPSMMVTHYYISLVKYDGEWLVMSVESDDLFYQTYRDSAFKLSEAIEGIDAAFEENEQLALSEPATSDDNVGQLVPAANSSTDRKYIPKNAVNYALTYSSSGDDGNKSPSYRNKNFYWSSSSCQLFVSQCIWAGFGGSNSPDDINDRLVMDTSGSYQWWSTDSKYNHPNYNDPGSPSDKGWNSWIKCSQFKVSVDGVKASSTESGIVCDTHSVPYNSDNMVGSSGLTKNDLIGAALHVNGADPLGHAVIINNATGTTRQTVYYTCYNNCAKNIRLSTRFPSSKSSTDNKIYVMVPRYLRGANGATSNYLYADLQNALVKGTSGVRQTLYGRSVSAVSSLTMKVYKPNTANAAYTFKASNKNVVSGSVLFNVAGEWKVVVSGTGLDPFTYIIRVV